MPNRPRDNQKSRDYAAEMMTKGGQSVAGRRLASRPTVKTTGNVTIEACQEYVDYVLDTAWFKARWGSKHMTVKWKASGNATSSRWNYDIHLPPFGRTEKVMLHEIAHHLVPNSCADHGKEFTGVLATLIRYQLGKDAYRSFREECKVERVKVGPMTKPMSEGLARLVS